MDLIIKREIFQSHIAERVQTYRDTLAKIKDEIRRSGHRFSGSDPCGLQMQCERYEERVSFFTFVEEHMRPEGDIAIGIDDIDTLELRIS